MINSLRGKVLSIYEDTITIDVSGFGLEVFASGSVFAQAVIGEDISCFAYLQISDAGPSLFGFSTERERTLFMELLQVKTVGGKLAIALLKHLDTDDILNAIITGSPAMITVPGLGSKRAERICFELKNKIAKKFAGMPEKGASGSSGTSYDAFVIEALTGLGFSQGEAAHAISASKAGNRETAWTEESLLKASLNLLQRR